VLLLFGTIKLIISGLFQQIKANSTLMQMVGADWIKSDKREDDLAGRPGGIVHVCCKFLTNRIQTKDN
jgi:hypothetical protein